MKCCSERRVHCIFDQVYPPAINETANYFSLAMVVYLQIGILLFGGQPTKVLWLLLVDLILQVIQARQLMGTRTQTTIMALVHLH